MTICSFLDAGAFPVRLLAREFNYSVQDPDIGTVGDSADAAEIVDCCDGEYDEFANFDAHDNGNPSSSPVHTDITMLY